VLSRKELDMSSDLQTQSVLTALTALGRWYDRGRYYARPVFSETHRVLENTYYRRILEKEGWDLPKIPLLRTDEGPLMALDDVCKGFQMEVPGRFGLTTVSRIVPTSGGLFVTCPVCKGWKGVQKKTSQDPCKGCGDVRIPGDEMGRFGVPCPPIYQTDILWRWSKHAIQTRTVWVRFLLTQEESPQGDDLIERLLKEAAGILTSSLFAMGYRKSSPGSRSRRRVEERWAPLFWEYGEEAIELLTSLEEEFGEVFTKYDPPRKGRPDNYVQLPGEHSLVADEAGRETIDQAIQEADNLDPSPAVDGDVENYLFIKEKADADLDQVCRILDADPDQVRHILAALASKVGMTVS